MKAIFQRHLLIVPLLAAQFFLSACGIITASVESMGTQQQGVAIKSISGKALTTTNEGLPPLSACAAPIAELYTVATNGTVSASPQTTVPVAGDSTFVFNDVVGTSGTVSQAKIQFLIRINACDRYFSRPVTDVTGQDVGVGSTLLEIASGTEEVNAKKLSDINASDLAPIATSLNAHISTTLKTSFDEISAPADQTALLTVFNISAMSKIKDRTPPTIIGITQPASYPEKTAATFTVNSWHWYYHTTLAYEWRWESSLESQTTSLNYTPNKNTQGARTVSIKVGMDDGASAIDAAKSTVTRSLSITMANTYPAVVPTLTLTSPANTASRNVTLNLATGLTAGDQDNCESFSALALTENDLIAPILPAAYTIVCNTNQNQSIPFTLATSGDGSKVLRLWAIDSSGNISLLAESVSVFLDTQNPAVTITDLPAAIKGGSINNIAFTYSDLPAGNLDTVKLYFAQDGSTFVEVADVTVSPSVWTAPTGVDVTTAKFRITAVDKAGNSATATTTAFKILSTLPVTPVVALVSATPTNSLVTSTSIVCDAGYAKVIVTDSATAPAESDVGWINCSSPLAHTIPSSADGTKTLYVWAKDAAGNISLPGSVSLDLDRTGPVLAVTTLVGPFLGGSSQDIIWTSTDSNPAATPVTLEYSLNAGTTWLPIVANQIAANTYSWTLPAANSSTSTIRVTAVDALGNSSTFQNANFTIDSTPPTLAAGQFSLNSGAGTTTSNFVSTTFTLSDNFGAEAFCLKYDDATAPTATDPCWELVTSPLAGSQSVSTSVTITNYNFQLGYFPNTYDVYLWAKDQVGLISTLSAAGAGTAAKDKASIFYDPGQPPVISSLVATKVALPDAPPSFDDLKILSGATVYIRWTASNAPTALPADAISLYYKLNSSSTWTPIVQGIPNAANGGCTADAGNTSITETGCYIWSGGSPSSSPYQVQLRVKNSNNQTSITTVGILNGFTLRTLAGNTDPGLDGSAKSAVYFPEGESQSTIVNQFAVAPNGNVYLFDYRGLLRIKPTDALNTLFIPNTGTLSGTGGNANSVTLDKIYAINIDYSGNLLVRTETAVLRIPTTTDNPVVTKIMGGGASNADGVTPLNYQFQITADFTSYAKYPVLIPLPNGSIYFNDLKAGQQELRYLDSSTGKIATAPISGTANIIDGNGNPVNNGDDLTTFNKFNFGFAYDKYTSEIKYVVASVDLMPSSTSSVRLDPVTFADTGLTQSNIGDPFLHVYSHLTAHKTGLDGNLYYVDRGDGMIGKLDLATNTFNYIVGTGQLGNCADGVQALSCQVNPQDLFVSSTGTVYFLDSGRIRTVLRDGTVFTLYGASGSAGDGQSALTARLIGTNFIQRSSDGRVQILQNNSHVIREISTAGDISLLAGTGGRGSINTGVLATASPLYGTLQFAEYSSFITEPTSADLFMGDMNGIYRLSRGTGHWSRVVGGGAFPLESANGKNGNLIDASVDNSRLYGIVSNKLYYSYRKRDPANGYADFFGTKTFNITSSYKQGAYEGGNAVGTADCNPTDPVNTCNEIGNPGGKPQAFFNDAGTVLFSPLFNQTYIPYITSGIASQPLDLLTVTLTGGGAYRNIPGPSPAADQVIYYCNNINIIEYSILSQTITNTFALPSGLTCEGHNMTYDSVNNRLIFIYRQNNINALGEYQL